MARASAPLPPHGAAFPRSAGWVASAGAFVATGGTFFLFARCETQFILDVPPCFFYTATYTYQPCAVYLFALPGPLNSGEYKSYGFTAKA